VPAGIVVLAVLFGLIVPDADNEISSARAGTAANARTPSRIGKVALIRTISGTDTIAPVPPS